MSEKYSGCEQSGHIKDQQPLSLAEILETERQEIEKSVEDLEARRPDHFAPLREQIEFGQAAARLSGMGDMVLKITQAISEIQE